MAREYLYKAKRKDNGEWVYFTPFSPVEDTQTHLIESQSELVFFEHDTICEYTGLPDKKGTKIFEGDICRFREWGKGDMCWIGTVHYEHQQYVISGNKNKECETPFTLTMSRFISEDIEVIGNKFDNPKLLEV